MTIPIHKNKYGKPYLLKVCKNERERKVQEEYYNNGWVVLKNGWPDLFCYNTKTKQIELIEVKNINIRKKRKGKKLGLSKDQLRMHQYLRKAGFIVKIIFV